MFQKNILGVLLCLFVSQASAEIIKDNSFLVEEAYNQEPGVVQFIQGWQYSDVSHDWNYSFTNEIPLGGETHQFSYVIPIVKTKDPVSADDQMGLGDILLNYRYQLLSTEMVSMAPRFSLIVPTGDYKKNYGHGALGIQFNHSVSITINEKWTNHWNVGATFTPDAKDASGNKAFLIGTNFASSAVYNLTPETNLLCEFVLNNDESITGPHQKDDATSYLILPGIRSAFKAGTDTEIVPGLVAILGMGPSAASHERGIFVYFSIESKLW